MENTQIFSEYIQGSKEGFVRRFVGWKNNFSIKMYSSLEFPLVEVKNIRKLEVHPCRRVSTFNVCACVFKFKCPVCDKISYVHSQYSLKFAYLNGCSNCSVSARQKRRGHKCINNDKSNKTTIELGKLGEDIVIIELRKRGYNVYQGVTGQEHHGDLNVRNFHNGKSAFVEVRLREFNHNTFDNMNRTTLINSKLTLPNLMADFYIGHMLNYNLFYIIPKLDLINKFNNNVNFNFFKIEDTGEKNYAYKNAWHLIDNFLK